MTAPAVVSWGARLGWLGLKATPLAFLGSAITVGILTVLALVELVTDKLPTTPSRLAAPGLIARLVTAGLSGSALALAGGQMFAVGAVLGALGGIAGAFGGYQVRSRAVRALGLPDLAVAIMEDVVAIGGALLLVTRF